MSDLAWQPEAMSTPWVESPFFAELLGRSGLDAATARLVQQFADEGYVIVDSGADHATLDAIAGGLEGRYRKDGEAAERAHLRDAWRFHEPVRKLALLPHLLELLRVLYRREPIPFQTLNFRRGAEERASADTIHFHCFPHRFQCGVWIALEDIDADNGPLRYYPKSHKLPIYDLHDLGYLASRQRDPYEHYARYQDFVEQRLAAAGLSPVELRVRRGQAIVWAANLFHGGAPVRDPERTRHSQVTHYYFEGGIYYTPLLSDPALGRIAVRDVHDLRDGRRVEQSYLGVPLLNPGEWPPVLEGDHPRPNLQELGRRADRLLSLGYASLRRLTPPPRT